MPISENWIFRFDAKIKGINVMKLLKFGIVVSLFMVFFSSFASEPFNNKFTSWWTWKPNEKCGEIQITKPTLETPQGYLSFVPESGKHGIQAYTHIKVDNQKCYQLTLKFKSTVDINKSAKIQFYIKGKNKNKSWQSLKPFLCKKISIEPGKTQTVSIIANLHEMKSDNVAFLVPHVSVSNLKKGEVKLESLKCVCIKPL